MARRSRSATTVRRVDTDDPSRSRERALRILFQADLRGVQPSVTLARLDADGAARVLLDERDDLTDETPVVLPPSDDGGEAQLPPPAAEDVGGAGGTGASGWSARSEHVEAAPIDGFTRTLVLGVERDRVRIEGLIQEFSRRWAISRMPVVDRNVLRLGTYELLHEPTPSAVVIDEAVRLVKRLSTDDSGRFINGVLEAIRQTLEAQAGSVALHDSDEPDALAEPSGSDGSDEPLAVAELVEPTAPDEPLAVAELVEPTASDEPTALVEPLEPQESDELAALSEPVEPVEPHGSDDPNDDPDDLEVPGEPSDPA